MSLEVKKSNLEVKKNLEIKKYYKLYTIIYNFMFIFLLSL